MKIIQSFAQFKEGSPYLKNVNVYLNFYTFLLSFLTLKKYYGHVTMYCNNDAYNSFIKYIPYNEIIIMESKYDIKYWSLYKILSIKNTSGDLIHVDSDVFIFDDLFRDFIDNDWDMMVQDLIIPNENFFTKEFVKTNYNFLIKNNIIKSYDGKCYSCGTLGLKNSKKNLYLNDVEIIENAAINNIINNVSPMIIEELTAYFVAVKYNLKVYEILNREMINEKGKTYAGNVKKYTHMWFGSKFDKKNINLIKNKIREDFTYYYNLVEKFDKDVLKSELVL